MAPQRPFRQRVFLFRMLAAIFAVEATFLAIAFYKCQDHEACPNLGNRSEQLFGVAIATTLSLLGVGINNKNDAS